MAKVGIVMGSDSDMPVMAKAADVLDKLGIDYEMTIISAHREPDVFFEYAKTAESRGFKVIIAGAGMAAHLPGMCAAIFPMPVIGIPMHTTSLGGRDSLYSIVQMPTGIPVATVAINGGANAGILAAKILATSDAELLSRLKAYSEEMKEQVVERRQKVQIQSLMHKIAWTMRLSRSTAEIKESKSKPAREDKSMDYKKAGVDIEAGYKSVELMKEHVKKTMRRKCWADSAGFPVHFPWKDSRIWKNRYWFPVPTDVEPK